MCDGRDLPSGHGDGPGMITWLAVDGSVTDDGFRRTMGAGMLLLEPAMFTADVLTRLKRLAVAVGEPVPGRLRQSRPTEGTGSRGGRGR